MTNNRNKKSYVPTAPKLLAPLSGAPRDIVLELVVEQALLTMSHDRVIAKRSWNTRQQVAALYYLSTMTHGGVPTYNSETKTVVVTEAPDYSALTDEQVATLQTIFMYVTYFESRLLERISLPGEKEDWFITDQVEKWASASLRHARKRYGTDYTRAKGVASAMTWWRHTFRKEEVAVVVAEAEESTLAPVELPVQNLDAPASTSVSVEDIQEMSERSGMPVPAVAIV